jgi:hypothetical protein
MLVLHHFLITSAVGIFGMLFFDYSPYNLLLFVFGGVFIDIDHIFSYWYYTKDISYNYEKIKKWCMEIGPAMEHFFLFHTIWFVLFLWIIQTFISFLSFLLYGVMLHVLLDIGVDVVWYFILKKNKKPYRRWFLPKSWLG